MEIDVSLLWSGIITLVIMPMAWAFNKMFAEVKRQQILLSKTREEIASNYAKKDDVKDDITQLIEAIRRLEDKLDKVLSK
jgi:hypothetical protein